jgi:hypothetical protein
MFGAQGGTQPVYKSLRSGQALIGTCKQCIWFVMHPTKVIQGTLCLQSTSCRRLLMELKLPPLSFTQYVQLTKREDFIVADQGRPLLRGSAFFLLNAYSKLLPPQLQYMQIPCRKLDPDEVNLAIGSLQHNFLPPATTWQAIMRVRTRLYGSGT